jgi:hypothetical protein
LNAYVPEEVISILYHNYKACTTGAAYATDNAAGGAVSGATAATSGAIVCTRAACATICAKTAATTSAAPCRRSNRKICQRGRYA